MPIIEPHIKNYIDEARKEFGKESERSNRALLKGFNEEWSRSNRIMLKEFHEDSKRHSAALLEEYKESLKAFKEVAPDLPDGERVREIVREEIRPLNNYMRIALAEIRGLRIDSNKHEKRISKLELQVA